MTVSQLPLVKMENLPPEIVVIIMMHGRIRPNRVPNKGWKADMVDPQLLRTHMLHRHKTYAALGSPDAAAAMAIELGHNDVLHHLIVCGKLRDRSLLPFALKCNNIEAADMLYECGSRAVCTHVCDGAIVAEHDKVIDWMLAHNSVVPPDIILVNALRHEKEKYVQGAIAVGVDCRRIASADLYKGMKARMECLIAEREPTPGTGYCFLSQVYGIAARENDVDTIEWMASKDVKPSVVNSILTTCSLEAALAVVRAGNVAINIVRAGLATVEEVVDPVRHADRIKWFLIS